jgi:hypothetical protein
LVKRGESGGIRRDQAACESVKEIPCQDVARSPLLGASLRVGRDFGVAFREMPKRVFKSVFSRESHEKQGKKQKGMQGRKWKKKHTRTWIEPLEVLLQAEFVRHYICLTRIE